VRTIDPPRIRQIQSVKRHGGSSYPTISEADEVRPILPSLVGLSLP
jgi:hypothetical protein